MWLIPNPVSLDFNNFVAPVFHRCIRPVSHLYIDEISYNRFNNVKTWTNKVNRFMNKNKLKSKQRYHHLRYMENCPPENYLPENCPPEKSPPWKEPLPIWTLSPVKITPRTLPPRKLAPGKITPWENYPQWNPFPTYKSYKWKKKQNYKIFCLEESFAIQHPYQNNQGPLWYTDDLT